jgi:hypothetical protein
MNKHSTLVVNSSHLKEIYWVTMLQYQLWWHSTQFGACVEPWPNPQNLFSAIWDFFLIQNIKKLFVSLVFQQQLAILQNVK